MVGNLNDWNKLEVERAERTWGHKVHPYTKDMFDFALGNVLNLLSSDDPVIKSWLDLGCGFGRFLEYLEERVEEPDYIGYDSSPDMIRRISGRFPAYSPRVFCRDITAPINNAQQAIICSAVLIHLPFDDQPKILENVLDKYPTRFVFDINSPTEEWLEKGQSHFERHIRGAKSAFRMTWQSHYLMTKQVIALFPMYKLNVKLYDLKQKRNKVCYFLEKR